MNPTGSLAHTASIQVVDDNPRNLAILTTVLAEQGYEVRTAISGSLALRSAQKRPPDLILLDILMPDMDGYQVCRRLKADERTRDIPVIFVSALDEEPDLVKAFSAGGVDYISKPLQEQEVLARVETHLALRHAQRSLEKTNAQLHELAHHLGERIKELNCLYGMSRLVETPGISMEDIIQGTAELMPAGWQYPEITCARIILEGQAFSTGNYQESDWQQEADIPVRGERLGTVQVGYLEERPEVDHAAGGEGPFLKEERNLLNGIAGRLGRTVEGVRAQQQARQQHRFLQNVLDSLTHPFFVINARNHTVELTNRAAHAGDLREEITCYALTHGRDRPCSPDHPCPLEEVRRTKQPVVVEHMHLDADGRRRDVEVHGFPILDGEGSLVQMIEYTLDITERKRAELMIRESEEKFRSLAENSQDYIMRYDAECRHLYENPAALQVSGLTQEEIIGKTHREAGFDEELCDLWEEKIGRVFQTGEPSQTVFEWESVGGRVHLDWRLYPEFDEGGNVKTVLGISRDITERVHLEAQNERLAALEERERIGRELHDDLAQVIGYVDLQAQAALARLEQGREAEAGPILAQLARAAQDANADLRQHILGIRGTRIPGISGTLIPGADQPAAQGEGGIVAALSQYLDTLHERFGLETQVSVPDWPADSPLAPESEIQLLLIIQEALSNVAKHAGVDMARILFTLHPDEVQVIIEDHGCGFDASRQISLAAGERTRDHYGLAIMRERAESVGGNLEVRSVPGQGCHVIVRLPLALVPPAQEELARGVRVLLVDDHPLYLEGLRTLLSGRGMQVVGMAHDGLEAQALALELRPDLILMDVQMPHCDGLEATRSIATAWPEVKIVMLTMAAEGKTLFEALKGGASGYLLKSLDGTRFFSLLADVMRGETVISPALANQVLSEFARTDGLDTGDTTTLTARQREVLELVARGLSNKEIAGTLHLSEATVKYHVSQILDRLQLRSRHQLAHYAQERGLAPPPADE